MIECITSLLNSPWGVAVAPQNFGALAGALLIGNFGDGHINGYNPTTGKFIGTMHHAQSTKGLQGKVLAIDGLWALRVGNDHNGKNGYGNALYFTTGPNRDLRWNSLTTRRCGSCSLLMRYCGSSSTGGTSSA
jgi:uncharacterized protein (TIGR03118 family)